MTREALELLVVQEPSYSIATDNMIAEWGGIPYSELSVMLVHLKFLYTVHQTHHWQAKGEPFYGDHLLFQRLYESAAEHIDTVAEKAVGVGGLENVEPQLACNQLCKLVSQYSATMLLPQPTDLVRRSLAVEASFLKSVTRCCESLSEHGILTRGVNNMIAGIEDAHEGAVYLLKQRSYQRA